MRSPNELVPLPKFRDFRETPQKQQIPGFPKKVLNEKKFSSRPPATLSLGSGTPNGSYPSAALKMKTATYFSKRIFSILYKEFIGSNSLIPFITRYKGNHRNHYRIKKIRKVCTPTKISRRQTNIFHSGLLSSQSTYLLHRKHPL